MANLVKTFNGGDFSACAAAERALERAGFSLGRMQRGDPRGILFGDYDIAKWRNLSARDREELHGVMTGSMRDGPVELTIYERAPQEAKREFHREMTAVSLVALTEG
jgi:hypothetical protein